MPIYSFGTDSPLKFELTEEFAESYNRLVKSFINAQIRYRRIHFKRWTPDKPLRLRYMRQDRDAFNIFASILEEALERYGKDVPESEITSDYLIKN